MSPARARWRFGIDSGGTFTDLVAVGPDDATQVLKVPSVPADPVLGPMNAIEAALARLGDVQVTEIAHGTTVGLNALLQRRFPRVALLVTRGFRNVLEIGRHTVPGQWGSIYSWIKPPRVVPLEHVFELPGRFDASGAEIEPLPDAALEEIAARIARGAYQAAAVCLLHSYRNDAHERRVAAALQRACPSLPLSLSCEIMPEFREYERTATTATNAVLTPLVGAYFADFARRAQARCGAGTRVLVMRSAGGVVDAAESASAPLRTALSGPAGGVLGMARLALAAGFDRALTFDMGGTSTDVAAVDDGEPTLTTEATIDCYPLRAPTIDLVSIGAGGGSLVTIGAGRRLVVGPLSAGAVPGPACYSRGGTAATVTDCNLLLGRLPDSLLGGAMALDRGAAERALQPGAAVLGLDTHQFAASALELVTHNMAGAVRQVAVRRGLDAREYVLVAFGGAGPPHAARLAQLVGIRTVLVPPHPGLGSCNGLLIADILLDAVRTCVLRGAALTAQAVAPVLDGLAAQLRRRAADASQASVRFRADLRYVGMGSEVRVAFADADRADATLTPLLERFHAEHLRLFGYDYRGRHAVELLALRAELRLPRPQSTGAVALLARGTPVPAPGVRRCQVGTESGLQDLRVYPRSLLPVDWQEQGPLLIDQYDTTTVVGAGQRVRVDDGGNLLLSIPET